MLRFLFCSPGSSVLRTRAGGHEANPAADGRQPAGVEADRGRAAAGVPDSGGGAPENAGEAPGRAGPRVGRGSGKPREVAQAAGGAQHGRELHQGQWDGHKREAVAMVSLPLAIYGPTEMLG